MQPVPMLRAGELSKIVDKAEIGLALCDSRLMDEIVACGNFVRAAERLHVTQTAVSVRVKTLEALLGRTLFVRNKSGATLTPAGEQFLRYAPLLVQVWERARQQVAVPPGLRAVITVAGELSLWNPFLLDWLVWTRRSAPQLALRTQVGLPEALMNQVAEGIIDIAVLYAPQHRPGLKIEKLMEERLVLVATTPRKGGRRAGDYVYVLAIPEYLEALNRTFGVAHGPARLEEHRFFGDFVLDGEARVADVEAVYDLGLQFRDADETLADFLAHRFRGSPVVGDRLRSHGVELVVRAVEKGVITRVGLKLHD